MLTCDQTQVGAYHVQDLREQARRDADADAFSRPTALLAGLRDRLRGARRSR